MASGRPKTAVLWRILAKNGQEAQRSCFVDDFGQKWPPGGQKQGKTRVFWPFWGKPLSNKGKWRPKGGTPRKPQNGRNGRFLSQRNEGTTMRKFRVNFFGEGGGCFLDDFGQKWPKTGENEGFVVIFGINRCQTRENGPRLGQKHC